MTSDDQHFLDVLSSIPNDVKKYSLKIADTVDRQIDLVADTLRESLADQSWLPQSVRPVPPPRPRKIPQPPPTLMEQAQDWVLSHPAWAAALVAFVGTGGVLLYRQKKIYNAKRRKARKAANGAKKEIVVIAGSPYESLTLSICRDLWQRGFVVFITVSSPEEERAVLAESRSDIRPLLVDITSTTPSPDDLHPSLDHLNALLTQPQYPPGCSTPHTCHLSALVLIPSPSYPHGPVGTIAPSTWADTLNTRLLAPVITTQMFLPLLSSSRNNRSSIVLVTPTIPSSLATPFNSPEVLVTRGLEGWASTLRRELIVSTRISLAPIDVVQLKLGRIDVEEMAYQAATHELSLWNASQDPHPGTPYRPQPKRRPGRGAGSPPSDLHNAVFDAVAMNSRSSRLFKKRRQVVYVGKGSWGYSVIGRWAPTGLVGWMLGYGGIGFGTGLHALEDSGGSEGWEKV